jgi:hypothetical protein
VVEAAAKTEARYTIEAYYKGFRILLTQPFENGGALAGLLEKMITAGFTPNASGTIFKAPELPAPEAPVAGKETLVPVCGIHNKPMVWREGNNRQTGRHYAFWACGERGPDGSFCKYRPGEKN